MARITVQPGDYQRAAVMLTREGVAVGEVVVLAVYQRHNGELCVTLGFGLPDGWQAARMDSASLPEDWGGWLSEREVEYSAQYLPLTFTAAAAAHASHGSHGGNGGNGGNGNGGNGGNPAASSGRWRKPGNGGGGNGGQGNQSSGRWRKPGTPGRPGHGGRGW